MTTPLRVFLPTAACHVAVHADGPIDGPVVLLAHAILSSSVLWRRQAELLASQGWRVLRPDTRGHGQSEAPPAPFAMRDLATDVVEVLDALDIDAVHYVGLSLGGMCGFALGALHPQRLLSLCLCDCRADAPEAFARPWDERIALVEAQGCAPLAAPTIARWLGAEFIDAHPAEARRLQEAAASTSRHGMVGCARAIQGLDYRASVRQLHRPTTLIAGALDGGLPDAMRELQGEMPGAHLEIIADAGHLPNIDQPERFDAALLGHLRRALERA